jgi:prepilin-type N-terminal cleavage/methylation domain-containing protein
MDSFPMTSPQTCSCTLSLREREGVRDGGNAMRIATRLSSPKSNCKMQTANWSVGGETPICILQFAICNLQSDPLSSPEPASQRRQSASGRPGFTLIEMLVVMAIIVLAVTLAVPAIRALTGTGSTQAAQNTVSAFLARARTEAIGLQNVQGVLFFIDPATDRVNCAQVMVSPTQPGDPQGITYLTLAPDHDFLPLPVGTRVQTMKDSGTPALDAFPNARYLGFNPYNASTVNLGGVILFDGQGRLTSPRYGFRFVDHLPGLPMPQVTALGQMAFQNTATISTRNWPVAAIQFLRAQIAFTLYDEESGRNGGAVDANGGNEANRAAWLDVNASPIFINRYNGTLVRAE